MRPDLPPDIVEQLERQHAQNVANINKLYGGRPPATLNDDAEYCCDRLTLVPLLIGVAAILGLLWYYFRDLVGVAPWGSM